MVVNGLVTEHHRLEKYTLRDGEPMKGFGAAERCVQISSFLIKDGLSCSGRVVKVVLWNLEDQKEENYSSQCGKGLKRH